MIGNLNIPSSFIESQRFELSLSRVASWVADTRVGVFGLRFAAEISGLGLVPSRFRQRVEPVITRPDIQERTQGLFTGTTHSKSPELSFENEPLKEEFKNTFNINTSTQLPRSAKRRGFLKDDNISTKGNFDKLRNLLIPYTLENLLATCQSDLGLIKLALDKPEALKIIHLTLLKRIANKEKLKTITLKLEAFKDEAYFRDWLQEQYDRGIQNYKEILLDKHPHSLLECDEFINEFPYLDECDCQTINSSIRTDLENQVIQKVIEKFNDLKNAPLTIVSVGGGSGFQDLIYLAKLSKAGYNHIKLVTIDKDSNTEKALRDLKKFKDNYLPELNLEIEQYGDLASLKNLEPQVILMIDIAGEGNFFNDSYCFFKEEGMLTNTILGYTNWTDSSRGLQKAFCKT